MSSVGQILVLHVLVISDNFCKLTQKDKPVTVRTDRHLSTAIFIPPLVCNLSESILIQGV